MRLKINTILLIGCFWVATGSVYSQENDFGVWTEAGVERLVSERLSIEAVQEIRMKDNTRRMDNIFTEFALEYELTDNIDVSGGYRFYQNPQIEGFFTTAHRFQGDISYSRDVGTFDLSYRLRYQSKFEQYYSSDDGRIPDSDIRHKFNADLELNKRYEPSFATELFYRIDNTSLLSLRKIRLKAGVDYELDKRNELGVYYLFQRQINRANPLLEYVISFGYGYTF